MAITEAVKDKALNVRKELATVAPTTDPVTFDFVVILFYLLLKLLFINIF